MVKGAPTRAPGIAGSALRFDGKADYVQIDKPGLDLPAATVESSAWWQGSAGNATIVEAWKVGEFGFSHYLQPDAKKLISTQFRGAQTHALDHAIIQPTKRWWSLASTYQNSTMRSWADGAVKSASGISAVPLKPTADHIHIGVSALSLNDRFDGVIDEVRIMNRALTADELLHYPSAAADRSSAAP